ncbi:MAG: hypothetical protein KDA49_10950 [Rhodospirillaceae bacterium]|nr:hypothetical protein [Rhodospirillaceae bacterium]
MTADTPHPAEADAPRPTAHVAFSGKADLWWLRLLRPGFRHCFLVLSDGQHWITLDPLSTVLEVAVQPVPASFDLPGWYRERGLTVLPARIGPPPARPLLLAPLTCVEVVKRALGISDRWVLTPFQLFRRLARDAAAPAAGRP